jgi:uncharacterized protein (TIGR03382 family)
MTPRAVIPIVFLTAVAVSLYGVPPVLAKCVAPRAELLWSYPADGDTDVPTNAVFWALDTRWYAEPVASLNGVLLPAGGEAGDAIERPLGELEPNRDYVLRLDYRTRDDEDAPFYEIAFRTGAGRAERLRAPAVAGDQQTVESKNSPWSALGSAECGAEISAQHCFDTSPNTLIRLKADEPRAIGWRVGGMLWPVRCGLPSLYEFQRRSVGEACYDIRVLGPGGLASESTRYCTKLRVDDSSTTTATDERGTEHDAGDGAAEHGEDQSGARAHDTPANGCNASSASPSGIHACWLLMLAFVRLVRQRSPALNARASTNETTLPSLGDRPRLGSSSGSVRDPGRARPSREDAPATARVSSEPTSPA